MNEPSQAHCPCGSKIPIEECCSIYINKVEPAPTAESLMRSRYTAYTQANMDYIQSTMRGKPLQGFNAEEAKVSAAQTEWLGLTVLHTEEHGDVGFVEFKANCQNEGQTHCLHEISEFHRIDNKWYYVDGKLPKPTKSPARNKPCPCGSGKKYKKCCGL